MNSRYSYIWITSLAPPRRREKQKMAPMQKKQNVRKIVSGRRFASFSRVTQKLTFVGPSKWMQSSRASCPRNYVLKSYAAYFIRIE